MKKTLYEEAWDSVKGEYILVPYSSPGGDEEEEEEVQPPPVKQAAKHKSQASIPGKHPRQASQASIPGKHKSQASIPGKHVLTEIERARGASVGGQVRASKLTAEERSQIARQAAQQRWRKV